MKLNKTPLTRALYIVRAVRAVLFGDFCEIPAAADVWP